MQKNALKKLLKSHKFDFILGAALLLAALCLFLVFREMEKDGGVITVKSDGKVVDVLSLEQNGTYVYETFYGSNTLTIKDGKAYVSESTCKDHICEDTGSINKVGETIICLPNALFISVTEGVESEYDGVVD